MFLLAVLIGIPLLIALSTAGAVVESIDPDELDNMGVIKRA